MNARMAMILLWGALGLGRPAFAGAPKAPCGPPPGAVLPASGTTPQADALPPASAAPHPSAVPPACDAPPAPDFGGFGDDGTDFEVDLEYLLWWTRSAPFPPLVTTSPPGSLGILGLPGTATVIGERFLDFNPRSGARFSTRCFIDEGWGIAAGIFFLENGSRKDTASGLAVLAVPTVDPASGAEAAIRLAGPGAATGAARLETGQRFWGTDVSVVCRVDDSREWKVDFFAGYRFLQLVETLKLRTQTTIGIPGLFNGLATAPGSLYQGLDQFTTRNSFNGGNLGGRLLTEVWPNFDVVATGQVAIGAMDQSVGIIGATGLTQPGQPVQFAAGSTYAQATNNGKFKGDRVAWVPQLGLTAGYRVNEWVRLMVGYDILYVSSVTRPGDQIDRVVDPRLPPIQNDGTVPVGAVRPFPRIERTDFWAQGLTVSVQMGF